ncbi:MAG: hypothetical protein GPJ13_08900 [Microcystis aeruginosa W11-06]|nr:hypothetical protein [Microcystis aeruginosa W11-03]NCR93874.1 hypothetical protein [Microcystis aeruginosa W11-06]
MLKYMKKTLTTLQSLIQSPSFFVYLTLLSLLWIAHFLFFQSFGLYEDDWAFTGIAINQTWSRNLETINSALITFWQGRPLHMVFLTILPFFGAKLGGISTLYLIGFFLLTCNVCLFYRLLRNITEISYSALIPTLLFCLYTADTTFNYLQHLLGLQPALLFVLIAFNLFVNSAKINSQSRLLSYFFVTLALLTYESPFLLFFAAPFLKKNTQNRKQIFIHSLILTTILFLYLGLRKIASESRISQLATWETLQKFLEQIIAGPVVVIRTFLLRPWQILSNLNVTYLIILLIATACFYVIITSLYEDQFKVSYHDFSSHSQISELIRLLKLGLLMMFLAYPSAILLDVNIIDGRASRVHFPAVMGTTLVMGSLWNLVFIITYSKHFLKPIIKVILSTYLALLLAFSINVQQYYAQSWQYQQHFWHDILTLSPDMTENTVILVQSPNLAWGKQINPFDWSVPSVLSSIYEFPKDWQFPPRAYILHSDLQNIEAWKGMIQSSGKMLISNKNHGVRYHYDWEPERIIQPQNVILLVEDNKKLIRQPKLTLSNGITIFFKQNDSHFSFPPFPETSLFSRLIPSTKITNGQKPSSAIYLEPQK